MFKTSEIVGSAFLLLSTVSLSDACPGQGGVAWTQLSPANSPSARRAYGMTYDAARHQIVLFGGADWNGSALSDTWQWDGSNWTLMSPVTSPRGLGGHAMAYDAARQQIVLFGGWDNSWLPVAETWVWNGLTWIQVVSANSPPARHGHAMAYDAARQQVVLFGVLDNDTWAWDGSDWALMSPVTRPSLRGDCGMAYDAARQRVVLFGGRLSSGLNDTWEWDGANWTERTPATSPSARWGPAMAYDAERQRVMLFGGWDSGASIWQSDTWEWDGSIWTLLSPATTPSPRSAGPVAYDAARQRSVLFGGWSGSTVLGDTWERESVSPASSSTFGTGCSGSSGIPMLNAAPFSSPWTGDAFSIDLTNLPPGNMTFMVTGLSNTMWASALLHLPAPLMSWGMPGCTVYTDVVDSELLNNASGTATWTKVLPNDANLIGLTFYNQGLVIDPGVNAMGATVSNAGEATIGMR